MKRPPETVGEIMAREVVTIPPDATLFEALKLMKSHNIGALVVVEGDRALGIVTERDIVRYLAMNPSGTTERVSGVMSKDLVVCPPDTPILRAALTMYERRIRRLPVVDQHGRLVGIITMRDLFNWVIELLLE